VSTIRWDYKFGNEEEDNSWKQVIKEDEGTTSEGYYCICIWEKKEPGFTKNIAECVIESYGTTKDSARTL